MEKTLAKATENKQLASLYGGYSRGVVAVNCAKTLPELGGIVGKEVVNAIASDLQTLSRYAVIGFALTRAKQIRQSDTGSKVSKSEYESILKAHFGGIAVSTAYQYERCATIFDTLAKLGIAVDPALIRALAKASNAVLAKALPLIGVEFSTLAEYKDWLKEQNGEGEGEGEGKGEGEGEGKGEGEGEGEGATETERKENRMTLAEFIEFVKGFDLFSATVRNASGEIADIIINRE